MTGIANATTIAAGRDPGTAIGMADGASTEEVIVILGTEVVIIGGDTIALANAIAERSPALNPGAMIVALGPTKFFLNKFGTLLVPGDPVVPVLVPDLAPEIPDLVPEILEVPAWTLLMGHCYFALRQICPLSHVVLSLSLWTESNFSFCLPFFGPSLDHAFLISLF